MPFSRIMTSMSDAGMGIFYRQRQFNAIQSLEYK